MDTPRRIDARKGLEALFEALRGRGYTLIGPTIRDRCIVYGELNAVDDLPAGWTDEQDGGHYRLKERNDGGFFGYAVGPHSFKQFQLEPAEAAPARYAFLHPIPDAVSRLRTCQTGTGRIIVRSRYNELCPPPAAAVSTRHYPWHP